MIEDVSASTLLHPLPSDTPETASSPLEVDDVEFRRRLAETIEVSKKVRRGPSLADFIDNLRSIRDSKST
jgi:hypothetical protein